MNFKERGKAKDIHYGTIKQITPRGVRKKWGVTPNFQFFQFFLHYFLENYTREPPITQEGGIDTLRRMMNV